MEYSSQHKQAPASGHIRNNLQGRRSNIEAHGVAVTKVQIINIAVFTFPVMFTWSEYGNGETLRADERRSYGRQVLEFAKSIKEIQTPEAA